MLTIFRRHVKACPHKSRRYRRCACPIWIEGSIGEERVPRKALNLSTWDAAEEYVRESNRAGKLGGDRPKALIIGEAIALYLMDAGARGLQPGTIKLHRQLLEGSLQKYAENTGLRYLSQLTLARMIEYRASWKFAPLTALKKFERLRSFFLFCTRAKWITENPLEAMKAPKADGPPTLPFEDDEVERIFEAAANFKIRGSYGRDNPTRVLAFLYVLRYAGCVSRTRRRLNKRGSHLTASSFCNLARSFPPPLVNSLHKSLCLSLDASAFRVTVSVRPVR